MVKKAKELDLPVELCLATAFKESSFRHYEYDANGNLTVNESAGDYGLMQINNYWHKHAFTDKETYGDIVNNRHDNINYGLNHLKKCYDEAIEFGYTGDELLKATYSNYNADSCSAYKDPNHPVHLTAKENVNGFWSVYKNKTWLDVLN
ncbi:MAG: transglycosylase SLT domain-containing protein [Clostridia bacterium]|nr:transglycosylase SLT domain-containing protein [Clostridia bacterium]